MYVCMYVSIYVCMYTIGAWNRLWCHSIKSKMHLHIRYPSTARSFFLCLCALPVAEHCMYLCEHLSFYFFSCCRLGRRNKLDHDRQRSILHQTHPHLLSSNRNGKDNIP